MPTILAKGLAIVLGALFYLAEEFLLGYLVARTVPKAYFDFFGAHKVVALVIEEAVLVALPAFVLSLGWGLAATSLVRLSPYRVACWTIAGLVMAWTGRLLQGFMELQTNPFPGQFSSAALLFSFLVPPVWGVLTSVSAPLGVLGAGVMAHRSNLTFQRTATRPLN